SPGAAARLEHALPRLEPGHPRQGVQHPRFLDPAPEKPDVRKGLGQLVIFLPAVPAETAIAREGPLIAESHAPPERETAVEGLRVLVRRRRHRKTAERLHPRKVSDVEVVVEDGSATPQRLRVLDPRASRA